MAKAWARWAARGSKRCRLRAGCVIWTGNVSENEETNHGSSPWGKIGQVQALGWTVLIRETRGGGLNAPTQQMPDVERKFSGLASLGTLPRRGRIPTLLNFKKSIGDHRIVSKKTASGLFPKRSPDMKCRCRSLKFPHLITGLLLAIFGLRHPLT